ncbi:lysylphosphatidylglycerol synthase domain-containing protein [Nodosilinea nodulosa]|uniref:lysylphosphatidylglycerol synthase domain-containing protein n=1 Tax=Nodosilinea nodulosa TaxID=416001 RepID=UPI0002D65A08|nr:lysylphosphatidylglycerol synthase domain-containing protein [Nodosilinea nodulosa]
MNPKHQRYLAPLIGLVLLAIAAVVVSYQLRDYQVQDIVDGLQSLPPAQVRRAIAFAGLGYLAMTGYDALGFLHLRQPLAYPKIALTAFISCAFSNTLGFSLVTGSAIRYRFYASWGIPAIAIAQVIAFTNISFWLGLLAVGGGAFLLAPFEIPAQLHLPFRSTAGLGLIFLALIALYIVGSATLRQGLTIRQQRLQFPQPGIALAQIAVSSLDWSLAAATLYSLLPQAAEITYLGFLKIYLLAMAAGVLSNVPGGLGVFETVVILLLAGQLSPPAVLASLLAYRGVYYFLPLAVALVLFSLHEFLQLLKKRTL